MQLHVAVLKDPFQARRADDISVKNCCIIQTSSVMYMNKNLRRTDRKVHLEESSVTILNNTIIRQLT
jgi:hypothetical protein